MSANNPERADKTDCVRKISRFEVTISRKRRSTTRPKRHCSRCPKEDIRRERFAEELAKRFSTNWRTVHYHVSGPKNTTLHMDDFLVNPSSINDLVRDGKLVEEARALGFRRLSFTDGFGNTWSRPLMRTARTIFYRSYADHSQANRCNRPDRMSDTHFRTLVCCISGVGLRLMQPLLQIQLQVIH